MYGLEFVGATFVRTYTEVVIPYGCAAAEWYVAGLVIARSWVQIQPMSAVYQCQLSMSSLRGRLMSTSESWGVNGHTYHVMH